MIDSLAPSLPCSPVMIAPPSPRSILLVDDDPKLREVVGYALTREGYTVREADHGGDALAILATQRFDLLVVDVSMPEVDGFEFVRRVRADDQDTPVLFLSARSDEIDRVLGLELGGDDYVTKPFSTRELVTRVKVIFRRLTRARTHGDAQPSDAAELSAGDLRLSPETHRIWFRGHEVVLTATEFRLLESIMGRPGRVYSREELSELAYPDSRHVSGRTLDSHVRRIRAKFRIHGIDPIETVHGVGYRLRES